MLKIVVISYPSVNKKFQDMLRGKKKYILHRQNKHQTGLGYGRDFWSYDWKFKITMISMLRDIMGKRNDRN